MATVPAESTEVVELIDGLTPDETAEKIDLLSALTGGSLREFIEQLAPQHAPLPRHLEPIIEAIERARLQRVRVCISMPPGHAKSLTILRAICWWLSTAPSDTCCYVSYSDKQAWGKSKIAREMAIEAGLPLIHHSTSAAEWRTVNGGGLLSCGVGGRLTGQRVTGLAVIDDPIKNRKEADSPTRRQDVHDWFNSVFTTRQENASAIVVSTRWHPDDLIGRLIQTGEWEVINLPAVAEEDDLLGRPPGSALWPSMYSIDALERLRREIGEFEFAALFAGRPRPRGSKVFGPAHYYTAADVSMNGCRIAMAADPAASERTTADYSAVVALYVQGSGSTAVYYVREVLREQVEVPQFVDDLIVFARRHGNGAIGVESAGVGKPIPKMLRRINPNLLVKGIIPLGDKFQRAQPLAAAWNDGRVLVPNDNPPWLLPFLEELGEFTGMGGGHDDQVDAVAHAFNMIAGQAVYTKRGADKPAYRMRR